MNSKYTVVAAAAWLFASSIVACGLVFQPPTSDDDGQGDAGRNDGGVGQSDGSVAYDGGIPHIDAGPDTSTAPCGDGVLTTRETCDDGNKSNGDGCNASCQLEPGWSRTGAPAICVTICGDGIVAGSETCDDDGTCPGSCRWSRQYAGTQYQHPTALAVDSAGAAVITGFYRGSFDFGGGPLVSSGISDVFITRIDATGKHVWSRRASGTGDDRAVAVATDAAGNVVVAGFFSDTIDFGGGPLVSAGSWDVFVVKLDAAGNHLWSKRFGDSAQQEAHTVAIDAAGTIVLDGMFWGAIDFGAGPVAHVGDRNTIIAKLAPSGALLWGATYGTSATGMGIAADAKGNVFAAGYFTGSPNLGGVTLTSAFPAEAIYLAKLPP
jgi:cysteine-rich repeat protein